ncbi:MAG: ABC transporter substrate-binding protein [Clostridia bacterium]|nr:ABC transporter substrate-binding protein [Clostridia bacterium]
MKRILSLVLALAMALSLAAAASAESVQDALKAASTMSNEELYEKAKEEIAAGAQLNFYSTTSFAQKAAANFEQAYPDLAGKIIYAEIDDGETYSILTRTIGTGTADMGLLQNGADLQSRLLDKGLAYAYFPQALKDVVPEAFQEPAVVTFINSLFIYNNGSTANNGDAQSINFTNVWELTEPEWKDRIFFKNPTVETVNINFLMMLTSPEWEERLSAAYEARYGKPFEAGEYESAAYAWIAGFLGNVNYTYTSASKMATGIASGAAGNMGLFVFSKLRKVDEADRGNLTVLQFENDVDGFSGFMYSVYATVFNDTDCPYTCALFINWLLDEGGFAGPSSWNSSQGYYSPNTTIEKPDGVDDKPYTYWQDKLVFEDADYILEHFNEVFEFIALEVG